LNNSILKKAIIPLAGLGIRMLPVTKAIPKEMLPVLNKPIIQYVDLKAKFDDFEEITLITHSSKDSFENHFDKSLDLEVRLEKRVQRSLLKEIKSISKLKMSIQCARQEEPKGLGHALCPKPITGKAPFGILLDGLVYDCDDKFEYPLANIDFAQKDKNLNAKLKKYLKNKSF
jgi:UTP--glucose-1-phosphate uridylyltransferase